MLVGFLELSWQKNREDEIRNCFYTNVDFHYSNGVEELNLLIETFQNKTYDKEEKTDSDSKIDGDDCNIFGENKKFAYCYGQLLRSNYFANFSQSVQNLAIFVCISSILFF